MKFTINRRTWYRGQGADHSALLKQDGTRCCVGFYARALGLKKADILCAPTLEDVNTGDRADYCDLEGSNDLQDIYEINDTQDMTEKEREDQIKAIFEQHDVQVMFRN